jgi:hypothetical protein
MLAHQSTVEIEARRQMKCPNCGLENPEAALRCDCGLEFSRTDGETRIIGARSESRAICARLNAVVLALLLILLVSAGQMFLNRALPEQWQYTIAAPKDEELNSVINKLGANGWELVSARRASDGSSRDPKMSYEMIFKKRGVAPDTLPVMPR